MQCIGKISSDRPSFAQIADQKVFNSDNLEIMQASLLEVTAAIQEGMLLRQKSRLKELREQIEIEQAEAQKWDSIRLK